MGSSLSTASSADVRDELTRNPNWVYMQDIFRFVGNVDGRMVVKILELDKSRWLGAFNLCDDGDDKLGYLQVGMMRQEQIDKRSASSMSVTDGEESVGEEQPPSKKPTPTARATRSKGDLVVGDHLRKGKDKGLIVVIHDNGDDGWVEVQWEGGKGTTNYARSKVSKWVVKPRAWVCSVCKKRPGDEANMYTPACARKADAVNQKPAAVVMCLECCTAATKNSSGAEKRAYTVINKMEFVNMHMQ
ncbi:hypothetical protein TeGR_g2598 [Tetraparma gracilis]|uniref:Uncharacterized protein n=1 Tax=Tetraparma gracilis TaxID=2962635 RepID=A0ABQ6MNZ4_9STRA|nr:hypothetical protein TeGR_g2598 [Tetraparma gracilis]